MGGGRGPARQLPPFCRRSGPFKKVRLAEDSWKTQARSLKKWHKLNTWIPTGRKTRAGGELRERKKERRYRRLH